MENMKRRAQTKEFVEQWRNRGDEKSDTQSFWLALLQDVFGIAQPASFIQFEKRVKLKNVSFIDARIPKTYVLIEQKSAEVDLTKPILQSDGTCLTPFQQAERYNNRLPYSQRNRWIVVCNFREFHIHDMERPNDPPMVVKLENLETESYLLDFLVDETQTETYRETQLSIDAGELVGRLYDALRSQYINPDSAESLRSLNILCVRLVFCFYAEDAGIFGKHNCVHAYLNKRRNSDIRRALSELFEVLDTLPEDRDPYMEEDLLAFPYVNGGLFAERNIEIPRFTPEVAELLIRECSKDFDWSRISPTIFGAVFESTLNPETRRGGGMHYTSIENIHKVIDPLFLEDLRAELKEIFAISVTRTREKKLREFHKQLGSLTFFDPACGSGNFLTETFLSLRRLENDILRALYRGQMYFNEEMAPIQISISQFYGIEINDFAVSVARTALWIAELQMIQETEDIVQRPINFLPLKSYSHIVEGNALRMDWKTMEGEHSCSPKHSFNDREQECSHSLNYREQECSRSGLYIMGNPPFDLGYGEQECSHSIDREQECSRSSSVWLDRNGNISITTGGNLPHWHQDGKIQFVTFRLADSLPMEKLEELNTQKEAFLNLYPQPWDKETEKKYYNTIGALADKWLDAGYGSCVLAFPFVRKLVEETILHDNGKKYLLHSFVIMPNHVHVVFQLLGKSSTSEIMKAWKGVSANRINKILGTKGTLWQHESFDRIVRSESHYLRILKYISTNPKGLSDEKFTLMGSMEGEHSCSPKLINKLEFGEQECSPSMNREQECSRSIIEKTAQGILNARALFPDCSLADLYDEATMPPELRKAHEANDRAVMQAYGFRLKMPESEIVAELMKLYQDLVNQER
ncbi:MAG: transposase [Planctomycetia bacterium]|nr:transposase [Planctomycetia bacterium]